MKIGIIAARFVRELGGGFHKTAQRTAQEQKALAWMHFDANGRRDEWPMTPKSKFNEVPENLREHYRQTFGEFEGDGIHEIVKRFKAFLAKRPIDRAYGLGPEFITENWKDAPDWSTS
jgi:hypothetical protein